MYGDVVMQCRKCPASSHEYANKRPSFKLDLLGRVDRKKSFGPHGMAIMHKEYLGCYPFGKGGSGREGSVRRARIYCGGLIPPWLERLKNL